MAKKVGVNLGKDVGGLNSRDVSVVDSSNAAEDTVKRGLPAIAIVGMVLVFLVIAVIIGCLIIKKCRKTGNLSDVSKDIVSNRDFEYSDVSEEIVSNEEFENIEILSNNPIKLFANEDFGAIHVMLLQSFLDNSFKGVSFIAVEMKYLKKFTVDNINKGSSNCDETYKSIKKLVRAAIYHRGDLSYMSNALLLFKKEISQQYAHQPNMTRKF